MRVVSPENVTCGQGVIHRIQYGFIKWIHECSENVERTSPLLGKQLSGPVLARASAPLFAHPPSLPLSSFQFARFLKLFF